jgi:hypothetical protein
MLRLARPTSPELFGGRGEEEAAMHRTGLMAWLAAAALLPTSAQAALLAPDITNTNQAITVIEGSGPSQLSFTIANPNPVEATFGGVLTFRTTFIGGDENDVPQNLLIGGGTCFAGFPGGAAVTLAPSANCSLLFTFTTRLLPVEDNDEGTVRLQFFTAFQQDVSGTTTSGFGFITVRDPAVNVPEPATLFLFGSGLLALAAARPGRSRTIPSGRGA